MPLPDPVIHATYAVASAYRGFSKLPESVLSLPGQSSPPIRRLLNNLCNFDGCRFLEVGALYGATAIAASYGNRGQFTTVDHFQQRNCQEACETNLATYADIAPVSLIVADVWDLRPESLAPLDVLLYEAAYDETVTRRLIERLAPAMAEVCIVVVNDWNWPEVRAGLQTARPVRPWYPLAHWEFFTADIKDRTTFHEAEESWWNGLFVGVYGETSSQCH